MKPHLLRHAFATYAVQVEGMPIDLVAKWLQQKNLEVTSYYSEMPEYMQVEQHASFVARLATQINVRGANPLVLRKKSRSKPRLQGTAWECWFQSVGAIARLMSTARISSTAFTVQQSAPDPEKRYQVEEKQRWAEERFTYYEREGLVLEAEKMRQLIGGL